MSPRRECSKRQRVNLTHPIAINQLVTIISLVQSTPYIEGLAVIKGTAYGRHRYVVRFIGDARTSQRVVHPIYQRDPEGAVDWLRELLRASRGPSLIEEFFPDDESEI